MRLLDVSSELDQSTGLPRRHGAALWGARLYGTLVGLSWAWREVRPAVIALHDPMAITSNVVLFDESGELLCGYRRVVYLNRTVYALNWQRCVLHHAARDHRSTLAA
jgi:hypothetical protein